MKMPGRMRKYTRMRGVGSDPHCLGLVFRNTERGRRQGDIEGQAEAGVFKAERSLEIKEEGHSTKIKAMLKI